MTLAGYRVRYEWRDLWGKWHEEDTRIMPRDDAREHAERLRASAMTFRRVRLVKVWRREQ